MKMKGKKILALLLIAAIMMSYTVCMADEQWFCANCGKRNAKRFCTQCGTPSPEPGKRPTPTPDIRWECLICGERNIEGTGFCGYCAAEKGAQPTPTPDTRWKCLLCGKMMDENYPFCGYCGAAKGAAPTPTPTPVKVGDIVKFGSYAGEKIEWRVLEVRSDSVLMISEYGLEAKAYNNKYVGITWEKCMLRKWLNEDFYRDAFSTAERSMIVEVQNDNPDHSEYRTSGGNSTKDKVWLLSIDEAEWCFANGIAGICYPTVHAKNNGASTYDDENGAYYDENGAGWWWLRSPGNDSKRAADVYGDGGVDTIGFLVDYGGGMVRPVVVVSKDFFK